MCIPGFSASRLDLTPYVPSTRGTRHLSYPQRPSATRRWTLEPPKAEINPEDAKATSFPVGWHAHADACLRMWASFKGSFACSTRTFPEEHG
eukprot:2866824-Amphidinium_carterae.1